MPSMPQRRQKFPPDREQNESGTHSIVTDAKHGWRPIGGGQFDLSEIGQRLNGVTPA